MAGKTANFDLQKLEAGDALSTNSYQFTNEDRDVIDRLLKLGAETHRHTGASSTIADPDTAPTLTLDTTSGNIPAGTTVRYKFAWVDANGAETAASPEATVSTPAAVSSPAGPTLTSATSGGSLLAGNYYYLLTCYTDVNTSETRAGTAVFITLPVSGGSTQVVTLTLPTLPSGADGFNVYRRGPGEATYSYLDSIDMTVATPPTEYDDDGSAVENCNRQPPNTNRTNSTNYVTVDLPGATPSVPSGYTWKIYRTYTAGDYSNSLLTHVVEETSEGSGVITPTYDDTGISTSAGQPRTSSGVTDSPSKIDLGDAAEVQGYLPVARNVVPFQIQFGKAGVLSTETGTFTWVCEFDYAEIQSCRAMLGRGSSAASSDVIIDVNRYDSQAATPAWATIYTTQGNRPKVEVGEWYGSATVPDVTSLVKGDLLTVDIDQVGGGATPTDEDLTVTIFMLVRHAEDGDTSPTGVLGIS